MGSETYSAMVWPLTRTARLSGRRRSPSQSGHAPQAAQRLQDLPIRPRAVVEAAAQVREQALEALAEGIALALGRHALLRRGRRGAVALRPVQEQVALLLRQLAERDGQVDAVDLAEPVERAGDERLVPRRPGRDGALGERLRVVRHDARRVEVPGRAEALAGGAGALRRVEREGARRHLGHAQAAGRAGHPPREQAIAVVEGVDDDDLVGQLEGDGDRVGEPLLEARLHDQPIDQHLDGVVAAAVEGDVLVQGAQLAVDAGPHEALLAQRRQLLLELALAAADDRRQHVDALVGRIEHHQVEDALQRLRGDGLAAVRAVRHADGGEQQAQVVVDLGDRADRRARVAGGGLLLDGDGRRQPVDQVDVRLLHLLEELPGVGRQRLDVAALALGVDGVEGERRLARAGQAGDHDQPIARQVDVDVLQVVDAGAANGNPIGHGLVLSAPLAGTEPPILHGDGPANPSRAVRLAPLRRSRVDW